MTNSIEEPAIPDIQQAAKFNYVFYVSKISSDSVEKSREEDPFLEYRTGLTEQQRIIEALFRLAFK